MTGLGQIAGLLIDIDGVLAVSWRAIPGAPEALERLRALGIPFRLMTNTTEITRAELVGKLAGAGLRVDAGEIVTAALMTADYLRTQYPQARCFVLGGADSTEDFEGIELVREGADVVVIGGASWAFSWEDMNTALRLVLDGAALVGMHSTYSWMTDEGMVLDSGAVLLRGLEAATGRTAVVCGKPAPQAFAAGLHALDLPADAVAMVGDDVQTDVMAAQASGLTGLLVRTGKFRQDALDRSGGIPDAVIDSIADLPGLLGPAA